MTFQQRYNAFKKLKDKDFIAAQNFSAFSNFFLYFIFILVLYLSPDFHLKLCDFLKSDSSGCFQIISASSSFSLLVSGSQKEEVEKASKLLYQQFACYLPSQSFRAFSKISEKKKTFRSSNLSAQI